MSAAAARLANEIAPFPDLSGVLTWRWFIFLEKQKFLEIMQNTVRRSSRKRKPVVILDLGSVRASKATGTRRILSSVHQAGLRTFLFVFSVLYSHPNFCSCRKEAADSRKCTWRERNSCSGQRTQFDLQKFCCRITQGSTV